MAPLVRCQLMLRAARSSRGPSSIRLYHLLDFLVASFLRCFDVEGLSLGLYLLHDRGISARIFRC